MPNQRAREEALKNFYQRFGLNPRQIDLIAEATPKSDYYMVSPRGNRLFSLSLGLIAKAFCGASAPDDQKLMDHLLADEDASGFAARWLKAKGLTDEATLLRDIADPSRTELREAS